VRVKTRALKSGVAKKNVMLSNVISVAKRFRMMSRPNRIEKAFSGSVSSMWL
jgi:hypothetical protein